MMEKTEKGIERAVTDQKRSKMIRKKVRQMTLLNKIGGQSMRSEAWATPVALRAPYIVHAIPDGQLMIEANTRHLFLTLLTIELEISSKWRCWYVWIEVAIHSQGLSDRAIATVCQKEKVLSFGCSGQRPVPKAPTADSPASIPKRKNNRRPLRTAPLFSDCICRRGHTNESTWHGLYENLC